MLFYDILAKMGVMYMRAVLINLGILLAFVAMYYFDFWALFTFKHATLYAFGLVIIVLLIGLKVLGNPFGKRK